MEYLLEQTDSEAEGEGEGEAELKIVRNKKQKDGEPDFHFVVTHVRLFAEYYGYKTSLNFHADLVQYYNQNKNREKLTGFILNPKTDLELILGEAIWIYKKKISTIPNVPKFKKMVFRNLMPL